MQDFLLFWETRGEVKTRSILTQQPYASDCVRTQKKFSVIQEVELITSINYKQERKKIVTRGCEKGRGGFSILIINEIFMYRVVQILTFVKTQAQCSFINNMLSNIKQKE